MVLEFYGMNSEEFYMIYEKINLLKVLLKEIGNIINTALHIGEEEREIMVDTLDLHY